MAELLDARGVDYAGADAEAIADIIRRLDRVLRALPERRVEETSAEVASYLQRLGLPQACQHACTCPHPACMLANTLCRRCSWFDVAALERLTPCS